MAEGLRRDLVSSSAPVVLTSRASRAVSYALTEEGREIRAESRALRAEAAQIRAKARSTGLFKSP
jgi:hypothetical protein